MMQTAKLLAAAALAAMLGAAPAEAGKDVFVIDLTNDPASLDPHGQWNPDSYFVYRNVFDNLLTRDDEGKIVPQIATAWRQVDPSTVEFTLRSDVRFHDGTPLTAEDVAFSVRRITSPAYKSPQLSQFDKIVAAEVVDPTTLRLRTDGPYPVLFAQLVKLSIVPKAHVEKVGDEAFNAAPMGSGPYRFVAMQRGVKTTLARHDGYWGAKGGFPTVEFHPVPDPATRVANLRSGRADVIVTINTDIAAQLRSDPGTRVLSVLSERVAYLQLNALTGPTADLRVRKAIAHAIDRQAIIDGLMGGYDKPVGSMLSPVHVGYVPGFQSYAFDLARAKALMREAGVAPGTEFVLFTSPTFDQRIVQALQQMVAELGVRVTIQSSDFANWLKRAQGPAEDFGQMTFSRWSCGCQDADGILFPLYHSSSQWAKFRNADIDKALEAGRSSLAEADRVAAYRRVLEIAEANIPLVPLYQAAILYGARKEVVWTPTPNESLFLNRMAWKD